MCVDMFATCCGATSLLFWQTSGVCFAVFGEGNVFVVIYVHIFCCFKAHLQQSMHGYPRLEYSSGVGGFLQFGWADLDMGPGPREAGSKSEQAPECPDTGTCLCEQTCLFWITPEVPTAVGCISKHHDYCLRNGKYARSVHTGSSPRESHPFCGVQQHQTQCTSCCAVVVGPRPCTESGCCMFSECNQYI